MNLFSSALSGLLTILSIAAIAWLLPPLVGWAVINGVWNARSTEECGEIIAATHGAGAQGACWAVLNEQMKLLLFGFYPPELYWRPILACALLAVALAPILIGRLPRRMLWFSAVYPVIAYFLIWGIAEPTNEDLVRALATAAGLDISTEAAMQAAWAEFSSTRFTHIGSVSSAKLGGFLLTTVIAVTGTVAAVPIGILLELARRSTLMPMRAICVAFIEFARGIPLIVLLFFTFIVVAYALPPGWAFDPILRAGFAVALPSAVVISEAIRAGISTVPRGQYEAAAAVGMSYGGAMRFVIIPQVFKYSAPRIAIAAVEIFKDTTILTIVGFLGPVGLINPIRASATWNGILWELYIFVAAFFFVVCFAMSRYSMCLDRRLKTETRRSH